MFRSDPFQQYLLAIVPLLDYSRMLKLIMHQLDYIPREGLAASFHHFGLLLHFILCDKDIYEDTIATIHLMLNWLAHGSSRLE